MQKKAGPDYPYIRIHQLIIRTRLPAGDASVFIKTIYVPFANKELSDILVMPAAALIPLSSAILVPAIAKILIAYALWPGIRQKIALRESD
jgi:hypothetical protein